MSDFGAFLPKKQTIGVAKTVLRDLSTPTRSEPLVGVGSISSHTRPVECLDGYASSDASAVLYTADTMGVIKVWSLNRESGVNARWRASLKEELNHHRTRINEMLCGNGQLWTGIDMWLVDSASTSPDEAFV